jgi:light-regulated signal transduction histidine kinase (bacteriophytochrome)
MLSEENKDTFDEDMKHYLDRINEGTQKMSDLIEDLLRFSRARQGEIQYQKVNVDKIVKDIIEEQREVEPSRDIEFVVNPLENVEADTNMVKVIFTNLITNAVKYTSKRGKARIVIGNERKDDEIQFFIQDNGVGFDMKYKAKLFVAFQRLHSDEEFKGTGIGLATVHRLVTKHGGKIWADAAVDKGATFYFTLPAKKPVDDHIIDEFGSTKNLLLSL